jgi:hypothetical protein
MIGRVSCYAHSPVTRPQEPMAFPYADTEAWLGVGADGATEWVYIGFNESPNLVNTTTEDGYDRIRTRIKWDDKVEDVTLTQECGPKFIHFYDDKDAIARTVHSSAVSLELNWCGEGKMYLRFSLAGSSDAITSARRGCGMR